MHRFNSVSAGNEFKDLCIEVLPAIGNIEKALEKAGVTESANVCKARGVIVCRTMRLNENWR